MKKILAGINDKQIAHALWASVIDGVMWAIMFGFAENYVLAFAVFFGANAFMTSLIQGSGQLAITVAQLLGAEFIQERPWRKRLAIIGNIIHGSSWLVMFFGAVFFHSPWIILIAYFVGQFCTNFAGPGWMSWMNDLVPVSIRGVFWGKRNNIAGIAQFVAISASGIFLAVAKPGGFILPAFGVLFVIAFIVRTSSIFVLNIQHEPPMQVLKKSERLTLTAFFSTLRSSLFGRFVVFSVLITFSVNIMNPIIPVYLLNTLGLDYGSFTLVSMSSMVVTFMAMSYWGPLSDKFGNYRILVLTAALMPLLAFAWVFVYFIPTGLQLPVMVVIQLINGFVWAGFSLSTTNYIFDSVAAPQLAKGVAYFNSLNNFAAFVGSLLGGALSLLTAKLELGIFSVQNLELIFILSGLMRLAVVAFFLKRFKEVRSVETSPPAHYFYIYQPMSMVLNRFQHLVGRVTEASIKIARNISGKP